MKEQTLGKTFARYVSLNVAAMIGLSCYILADTFFVSASMGADGLAALNLAIPAYNFVNGIGLMIGIGGATRYAISRARGDAEEADRTFTHAVGMGLACGVVFMLIGLLGATPLSRLLGGEGKILDMTATYLRTLLAFSPMFILNNTLVAFVRNDGWPNYSMIAMLLGSGFNIVMDYVLVFPCRMGIFGAALATGFSPVVSMLFLAATVLRRRNFHLCRSRPQAARMRSIATLGLSSLIAEASTGIVMIVFNLVILRLEGNLGVAAYGVIANLALVAASMFTGVAQGSQPVVSTCYGRGEHGGVRKILRLAAGTALGLAALLNLAVWLFPQVIVGIFNSVGDAALAALAVRGLPRYFCGFFLAGLNIVLAAILSAVEKPGSAFVISILRGGAASLPLLFLLSAVWGMDGVWFSFPAAEAVTLAVALLLAKKSRWL